MIQQRRNSTPAVSLLSAGIYSIDEAARLVEIPSARLRKWVSGVSTSAAAPLIRSDIPRVGDRLCISFVNLIEAKFIASFAKLGIHVRTIRQMAVEAADYLQTEHPFATSAMFRADSKTIYIETARKTQDPKLYDLKRHNFAFHKILDGGLVEGVEFKGGLADAWFPRRSVAPLVRVTPKVSFGSPALRSSGVPTVALVDALRAESGDHRSVARWFDVPVAQVHQAEAFEQAIKKPH